LEVFRWVQMNPSILICKLATLEHAFAHTKGQTDDDMIGAIFANAPEKNRATLNPVAENQGNALHLSHLEVEMRKIWRQGSGSKGLSMAKKGTEIVLNAFTGIRYVCKEKGHQATHCPNKDAKGGNKTRKRENKN